MNITAQRQRLYVMFAINGVCVLLAAIALYGHIRYDIGWLMIAFIALLVVGFAAQIWFIAGFAKAGKAP